MAVLSPMVLTLRLRGPDARQQQGQHLGHAREPARIEVVGSYHAVGVEAAAHIHELRRPLGLPAMLIGS